MTRRIVLVLTLVVSLAVAPGEPASAATIGAEPVATGLSYPAMFTFAPGGGTIFYTEKSTGRIRRLSPGSTTPSTWFTVKNLCTSDDQGLFGIALHPAWPAPKQAFVYVTRLVGGTCRNQVLRIDRTDDGFRTKTIFTTAYLGEHIGGRLAFGPDGHLWLSTGDNNRPDLVQQRSNTVGKVLRMTTNGDRVPDSPWSGQAWARGFRNVFGLDWDPETGNTWASENGPECNDELNRIVPGGNYGWGPSATCASPPDPPANTNQDGPSPVPPELWYEDSDGPTGLAFCDGCGLGAESEGKLFYGAWLYGEIRRVTLTADRTSTTDQTVVYTHVRTESPLSIEQGPDGALYFSDKVGIYKLTLSE